MTCGHCRHSLSVHVGPVCSICSYGAGEVVQCGSSRVGPQGYQLPSSHEGTIHQTAASRQIKAWPGLSGQWPRIIPLGDKSAA